MTEYLKRVWSALSQLINVVLLMGEPNESISGRCYREPWPRAMAIINALFFWQVNHCRSAYTKDLEWAKNYLQQDLTDAVK